MPAQGSKPKIGNASAVGMIMLALVLDAIQFGGTFLHVLPIIGTAFAVAIAWFVGMLAVVIFGIWFKLCGVSYIAGRGAGRRFLIMLSAVVVELVPIIDAVPGITLGVVFLILETRLQDGHIGPKRLMQIGSRLAKEQGRARALGSSIRAIRARNSSEVANDNNPSDSR